MYLRPPVVLHESPRIVGGRDELYGGTWMGATERGLFVGITNQRSYGLGASSLRSRGEVVLEALRAGDTGGVTRMLEALDPSAYNSFNLLYGDAAGLRVAYSRREGTRVEIEAVPDGVHVLPNDCLDSGVFPKVERARALAPTSGPVEELAAVLRDHDRPPLDQVEDPPAGSRFTRELVRELHALCIHTPAYGTRSSTIVALAPGRVARYLFADGPPCTAALEDVTALVSTESPSASR